MTPRLTFGMPVAADLARAAQRDLVQHREVVLDDRGLADDDRGGVVEHDAPPDASARVDVDGEHLGDAALQEQRQRVPFGDPEMVGDPVATAPRGTPSKYSSGWE
jgi:hypothetical protein